MFIRLLSLISFVLMTSNTLAAGIGFNQTQFDKARHNNEPVLLMVHADWCPTCRAQSAVIDKLAANPEFSKFRIFRIDYDTQKGLASAFRVHRQSALLVFKGEKEVSRSIGETSEDAISTQLKKAL